MINKAANNNGRNVENAESESVSRRRSASARAVGAGREKVVNERPKMNREKKRIITVCCVSKN